MSPINWYALAWLSRTQHNYSTKSKNARRLSQELKQWQRQDDSYFRTTMMLASYLKTCWLRWIFKSFWGTREMFRWMTYSGEFHHSRIPFLLPGSTGASQSSPRGRWGHHRGRANVGAGHPRHVTPREIPALDISWGPAMKASDPSFSFSSWNWSLCTFLGQRTK